MSKVLDRVFCFSQFFFFFLADSLHLFPLPLEAFRFDLFPSPRGSLSHNQGCLDESKNSPLVRPPPPPPPPCIDIFRSHERVTCSPFQGQMALLFTFASYERLKQRCTPFNFPKIFTSPLFRGTGLLFSPSEIRCFLSPGRLSPPPSSPPFAINQES